LWQISANAYRKAYLLKEKATLKALDKEIMSLEKKYDLKEAENKALQLTNRLILTGFVSLTLLILLVTSLVIFVNAENTPK
jgi:phosphopantetheinyl transferase (holo-ACP synthase)